MSAILVFNASRVSTYTTMLLSESGTCLDNMQHYAEELGRDINEVLVLSASEELPRVDGWKYDARLLDTASDMIDALCSQCTDTQTIIYAWLDQPFLSVPLTRKLLELHSSTISEYTFADGYPDGMAPEILHTAILPAIRTMLEKKDEKLDRNSIFRVLERDINAFDIETDMATEDCRLLRVELSTDTRRNFFCCRNIAAAAEKMEKSEDPAAQDAAVLQVLGNRHVLRTLPAYIRVQLSNVSRAWARYEPFGEQRAEPQFMSYENFTSLLDNVVQKSPEAVIALGYRGEVAEHPSVIDCIAAAEERGISLYIETSGVGWKKEDLQVLCSGRFKHSSIIIALDSVQEDTYRELRGDNFQEAMSFAHALVSADISAYLETTRLEGKEAACEEFYKYWKEHTDHIIIKKYNHFCGKLVQRKPVDLSPLVRTMCWKSEREISILLDGTVPLCEQDIDCMHVLGNVFQDGLETVWDAGEQYYLKHIERDYPDLCRDCDEYYVFNA